MTGARRLAAILAADMVGYSQLMADDEAGTIARLKTYRLELVDPTIARFRGRIVKTTGDGMLVEFASVVDAVSCAVDIQQRLARRNADVPADRKIEFRVGINLGDIVARLGLLAAVVGPLVSAATSLGVGAGSTVAGSAARGRCRRGGPGAVHTRPPVGGERPSDGPVLNRCDWAI